MFSFMLGLFIGSVMTISMNIPSYNIDECVWFSGSKYTVSKIEFQLIEIVDSNNNKKVLNENDLTVLRKCSL